MNFIQELLMAGSLADKLRKENYVPVQREEGKRLRILFDYKNNFKVLFKY